MASSGSVDTGFKRLPSPGRFFKDNEGAMVSAHRKVVVMLVVTGDECSSDHGGDDRRRVV